MWRNKGFSTVNEVEGPELPCQGTEEEVRRLRNLGVLEGMNYGRPQNLPSEHLPHEGPEDTVFTKVGKNNLAYPRRLE